MRPSIYFDVPFVLEGWRCSLLVEEGRKSASWFEDHVIGFTLDLRAWQRDGSFSGRATSLGVGET